MDNKLSELSKPVFEIEVSGGHWLNCSASQLTPAAGADFTDWPDGVNRLYSQEYVSALLSQIEADSEIKARLCRESNSLHDRLKAAEQRIAELEAKLATPVRLPEKLRWSYDDSTTKGEVYAFNNGIDACSVALYAAGFTVEGDE